MKAIKFLTAALAGFWILGAAALPVFGQGQPLRGGAVAPAASTARPAPSGGTRVAVIDLQEVFKQSIRFKAAMDDIQKDTEALTAKVRGEQQKLQGMVEDLKNYKPGTPDYKQREEQIALIDSNVRVQLQLERKELRDREAKVYYQHYEQVLGHVQEFAERNGIALVIRFSADEIDPANPESIMMGLNRHVVYQRNLNITEFVIKMVNTGVPVANQDGSPRAPVIPPRRQ